MTGLPALLCVTGHEADWDYSEGKMETCDRNKGIPRPGLEMDPDQSSRSSQPLAIRPPSRSCWAIPPPPFSLVLGGVAVCS